MTDAIDAIPPDAISLIDAYQIVFEAITPNSSKLLEAINPAQSSSDQANREAWAAYDLARLKANVWLRQQIADKLLIALIRDPELGEVLKLPHIGWEDPGFLDSEIHENFVGPDDIFNPGPSTVLHGNAGLSSLICDAFERLVRERLGAAPPFVASSRGVRGSGRPPKHDWHEGELFGKKLLEERGDPTKPENQVEGWRSLADLARAIMEHMAKHSKNGQEPPLSSARKLASQATSACSTSTASSW